MARAVLILDPIIYALFTSGKNTYCSPVAPNSDRMLDHNALAK